MRGTERVHHEDVAQRRVTLCQRVVVLAFANVHAAVFQQHYRPGGHVHPIEIVGNERYRRPQPGAQPCRHRSQ